MANYKDPLHLLGVSPECAVPGCELTAHERVALHAFKHEVLAAGYVLYGKMDQEKAAKIIGEMVKHIAPQL